MSIKELLQQYETAEVLVRQLKTEYEKELEQIDALRSPLSGDGQPGSKTVSKSVERQALKLAEKAEELKQAEADAIAWRQYIFSLVHSVPDVRGAILYERYVNLRKWDDVADAVGYSRSRVHELHNEAIDFLEKNKSPDTIGHSTVLL